jgi:hypothetical protein
VGGARLPPTSDGLPARALLDHVEAGRGPGSQGRCTARRAAEILVPPQASRWTLAAIRAMG